MDKYEKYLELFTDWVVVFAPKFVLAIIILIIGFWIVKKVNKILQISLGKANLGIEITTFLLSMLDIFLKFVVVLIAAGTLGFQTSSLLGVLAAAGFAIGLALQGFMGNFASGITIVFFKPYRVGDWVEISEKFGKVDSIQIFNTTLITPGNKTLIIPNGQVTDNIITNFSTVGYIRLKLKVTMPYGESYPRVKQIIKDSIEGAPNVLESPEVEIGILEYDTHFITLVVRPSIHPNNYWDVTFDVHERIKNAFSKHGVKMSYSEGIELGDIGE